MGMDVSKKEITLRFLVEPTDANFGGNMHGGIAMKWLDQAGYACATGWSGRYCVTAFVGNINFRKPIAVGHLIEINAKVIHTGTSSMHLAVNLSSGDTASAELSKAMHCIRVFVAIDEDRAPSKVPAWSAASEEDIRLEKYAITIKNVHKANKYELDLIMD